MKKSRALLAWLGSLGLLAITAGQSWQSFELSASAGGAVIQVSGFSAFPVIGALVSLQMLIILVSLLVKPLVTRILAALCVPFMVWVFIDVVVNSASKVQDTFVAILADQTGVLQEPSSSDFLTSSTDGVFTTVFLISLTINSLILVLVASIPLKVQVPRSLKTKSQPPEDLWSSQN